MEDKNGMIKYISCDALKKAFARVGIHIRDEAPAPGNEIRNLSTLIGDVMKSVPAADVAPVVHGRWQNTYCAYRCSECGRGSAIMTNFCPECGALMSRAQNSKENAHASD